ncbi:MAG: DUF4336 domain-containing protein [Acetobacteraceae bacterium]
MADVTYPPLNTLKPVAENVWIVDGPAIRFGLPWPKMSFPTRMTVIRLEQDRLFIHSPTHLVESLRAEIATVGKPAWLIGPNRLHYWWLPDWRDAYPNSGVWLAPGIREQARGRIGFAADLLPSLSGYPWDDELATLPVAGGDLTEFAFFHRRSATLVLTDLIENFEPAKLGCVKRGIARLGGVLDPDGQIPRDMRLTFRRHQREIREAVETMIGWGPERIVLAHGRWYDRDGATQLVRAFRWALARP